MAGFSAAMREKNSSARHISGGSAVDPPTVAIGSLDEPLPISATNGPVWGWILLPSRTPARASNKEIKVRYRMLLIVGLLLPLEGCLEVAGKINHSPSYDCGQTDACSAFRGGEAVRDNSTPQ
jgi:hypothetical protein